MNNRAWILSFAIITLLTSTFARSENILDFSKVDLKQKGYVTLDGQWEFYDKELLNPKDFLDNQKKPTILLNYKTKWKNQKLNSGKLSNFNFATYRIKVKINKTDKLLSLRIHEIQTAYKLFVNGKEAITYGVVGKSKGETTPSHGNRFYTFQNNSNIIELILQVSNFQHSYGGPRRNILLGTNKSIQSARTQFLVRDVFLISVFLIIAAYHLAMFLSKRENMSPLFFGLFCVLNAIRIAASGETLLLGHYHEYVSWNTLKFLSYTSFYLTPASIFHFAHILFPEDTSKKVIKASWFITFGFSIIILFTKPHIFSQTLVPFLVYTIIASTIITANIIHAIIKKRRGSTLLFSGFTILLITTVSDFLISYNVHDYFRLAPFGLMLFILIQSILISRSFAWAFNQVEITQHKNTILKELDKQKTKFFQNISHELRTPLTFIMTPIEHIKDLIPDNQDILLIERNAKRLYRLLNQLLDFQKISSKKKELDLEPISMIPFLESCSKYFIPTCKKNYINFKFNVKYADDVSILGQIDALEKIVFNYFSNAFKNTGKDGTIELSLEPSDAGYLRISIIDTGIGISHENQEKLFKVFSQTSDDTINKHDGTGLGLALVKELATGMNGTVGVQSIIGQGSTFWVEFPAIENKKRILDILCIDDDPGQLDQLDRAITMLGSIDTARYAKSTALAREILKTHEVKCIVSDANMPDENGVDFLAEMAQTHPNATRILITGEQDVDLMNDAVKISLVNHIITKPWDQEKLITILNNVIEKHNTKNSGSSSLGDYTPKDWHILEDYKKGSDCKDEINKEIEISKSTEQSLILVIDDLVEMRALIRKSLKKKEYCVVGAEDAESGMELVLKRKPDLIICDWMLPGMLGPQFIMNLQDNPEYAAIPTILLTARTDEESKQVGNWMGASAYMEKPFDEIELLTTVENLLKLTSREKEVIRLNEELSKAKEELSKKSS